MRAAPYSAAWEALLEKRLDVLLPQMAVEVANASKRFVITNPLFLVEALSPGTEASDREEKCMRWTARTSRWWRFLGAARTGNSGFVK
ncbi:MAG: hypothetical protein JNM66_11050 [Bryobacterales bacterium]|nr:hypothetical protein [Bryobacterales bacterium]